MPAIKRDLTIEKGATFEKIFILKDTDGNEKDLSGYTAAMHIRSVIDSTDILVELTTTNGGVILNASPGQVKIRILATVTKDFTWNDAVYDFFLTSPSSKVDKLFAGGVKAANAVTR